MEREMKDSGIPWIGEIPKDWDLSKYKFHSNSRMGETILKENLKDEGIPVYSATQSNGIFGYVNQSSIKLHKGDFVIPARGNSIGFVSIVEYNHATCSQTTICSYNFRNIFPKFLYFCCYGLKDYWFEFDNTAIPQITVEQVKNNALPLPNLQEQKAIAEFLDRKCGEIDELISLQERMIEELKAYKQSVITEAVTKGLNPNAPLKDSGIDWIGQIPEHWNCCRIKDIVNLQSGRNLTTEEIAEEGNYPVYGGNGIRGYYHKFSNEGEFILIGRQGALCGNINYAYGKFWPTEHAVVCYPKIHFSLIWFGELLRSMNLGQYSLSSAQPGLAVERIKNLSLPIPPLSEQQDIADFLDKKCSEIDSLIELKQQKIEELKDYKKSIIYEYVTGKKEVEINEI